MLDERLGKIHFWTLFIGFHTTFLVQHWLGAEGMPRRYADYLAADGFTALNTVSTIGAFLLGLSTLPFLYNVWKTARYGAKVEVDDPWGFGRSLEWATSCPPPRHNFTTLPRIRSESPAFDLHHPEVASEQERDRAARSRGRQPGPVQTVPDRADVLDQLRPVRAPRSRSRSARCGDQHFEAVAPGVQQTAVLVDGLQHPRRGRDALRRPLDGHPQQDGGLLRRTRAWRRPGRHTRRDPRRAAARGEAGAVRRGGGDAVDPVRTPVVPVHVPGDQVPAALGRDQAVRFRRCGG